MCLFQLAQAPAPGEQPHRLVGRRNVLRGTKPISPGPHHEETLTSIRGATGWPLRVRCRRSKDQIICSAVILKYVLMDEFLSAVICWHYFGKKRSFSQLWKTKRFRSFNHFVLERLYLLQKLDLVKSVHDIPKPVAADPATLNDLRNGIAHSFFPQNRRRKPEWKRKSIFTDAGFERFLEDMGKLSDFFVERFSRGSPEGIGDRPDVTAPETGANGA